jgi:hypothetical protein
MLIIGGHGPPFLRRTARLPPSLRNDFPFYPKPRHRLAKINKPPLIFDHKPKRFLSFGRLPLNFMPCDTLKDSIRERMTELDKQVAGIMESRKLLASIIGAVGPDGSPC